MNQTEYNQLIDTTLQQVEHAVEHCGAEIDFEMSAGILELEFENGSKIILNRQSASQELWVAARSGGFHFVWKDGCWRNTRDGGELFACLSACASEQSGHAVVLSA